MQLDLFDDCRVLELTDRMNKIEKSQEKVRRSAFARINDLEKQVLDLQNKLDALLNPDSNTAP